MCYIVVAGRPLSKEEVVAVKSHAMTNRDGMGFAYYDNQEQLVLKKGQWAAELLGEIEEVLLDPAIGWRVVHFRLATSGGVHPSLAHPFRTRHGAFAFNGHISDDLCLTMAIVLGSRGHIVKPPASDAKLMARIISAFGWAVAVPIIEQGGRGVLLTSKQPYFAGNWYNPDPMLFLSAPLGMAAHSRGRAAEYESECIGCERVNICDACDGGEFARFSAPPVRDSVRKFKPKCNRKCEVGGFSLLDVCEWVLPTCPLDDFSDDEEYELSGTQDSRDGEYESVSPRFGCEDCRWTKACDVFCHPLSLRMALQSRLNLPVKYCSENRTACMFPGLTVWGVCQAQMRSPACIISLADYEMREGSNEGRKNRTDDQDA